MGIPWEQYIFPAKILISKMPICHDLFSAWQITTSYEVCLESLTWSYTALLNEAELLL
jgi:hypothetical protein